MKRLYDAAKAVLALHEDPEPAEGAEPALLPGGSSLKDRETAYTELKAAVDEVDAEATSSTRR